MESQIPLERLGTKGFWILFAMTQVAALVLLAFANVHTNPLPLLLALPLLTPGILVTEGNLPEAFALPLAIAINAGAWYLTRKVVIFAAYKLGISR
jgi:prepilin signal peptidase PulO-like enzyme (type II secretory pathway)